MLVPSPVLVLLVVKEVLVFSLCLGSRSGCGSRTSNCNSDVLFHNYDFVRFLALGGPDRCQSGQC